MQCRSRWNTPNATWNSVTEKCSRLRMALARATPGPSITLGREEHGLGVLAAAFQPRHVLCSDGSHETPDRLGPNGPKLLPRPVRPKSDGSRNKRNGGGGSGGGGSGGGKRPGALAERTLASMAAYTGLIGTTALVLGKFAGIDLWGAFDWESLDDLKLAAAASVPLQLLNAALLLPSYSSQKQLPDLSNLEVLDANLRKEEEHREKAEGSTGSAATAAAAAGDSAAPPPPSPVMVSAAESPSDVVAQTGADVPRPASLSPSAARTPSAASAASSQPPGIGLVPAGLWGRSREGSAKRGGEDLWTALRSALHLAQGYYISNNPTARLTIAMEASYTLLDTAAGEMLYRGVVLTWLAGWLQDRVYEAGVDELMSYQLPEAAAALGLPSVSNVVTTLGVYGACECVVAAAVAAFVVWSVTSRSRRAVQRLELLMSVTSSTLSSSSSSPPSPSGRSSAGAASGAGDGGSDAKASSRGNTGTGGGDARSAAAARAAAQVLFGPGGPNVGASSAATVMRRAAAIQASRDAFQILLLNGVFIASGGNLAASYTASIVNQLLISAMQRRGVQRMRERSAALARELRAYNTQMKRIAKNHRDKLPQGVAARLDRLADEDTAAKASTASASTSTSAASATISTTTSSISDLIDEPNPAGRSDSSNNGAVETASSGSSSCSPLRVSSAAAFSESIDGGSSSSSSTSSGSGGRKEPLEGGSMRSETHNSLESSAAVSTAFDLVVAARPAAPVIVGAADSLGTSSSSTTTTTTTTTTTSISDPVGNSESNGSSNSSLCRALSVLDMLVPEPPKPVAADRKRHQQQQPTPQLQQQQ